jgi:hypothetical protein
MEQPQQQQQQRRYLKGGGEGGGKKKDCTYIAWKGILDCGDSGGGGGGATGSNNKNGSPPAAAAWHPPPSAAAAVGGVSIQGGKFKARDFLAAHEVDAMGAYLGSENRTISSSVAFGIISSFATAEDRMDLLKLWWLPGGVPFWLASLYVC